MHRSGTIGTVAVASGTTGRDVRACAAHRSVIKLDFSISHDRNSVLMSPHNLVGWFVFLARVVLVQMQFILNMPYCQRERHLG